MQFAIERKASVSRLATKPLSQADKELEAMKVYMKKVSRSKKAAQTFLEDAGIVDKQGRLAKQYRS